VLTSWRLRLRRKCVNGSEPNKPERARETVPV
jgi:hypothetical protein